MSNGARKVNTQDEAVKMRTKQDTPLHTDAFWCCSSLRDVTGGVVILLGISVRLTGLDVFLSVALLSRPCKESPWVGASPVLTPLLIHKHLLPQNANSNM